MHTVISNPGLDHERHARKIHFNIMSIIQIFSYGAGLYSVCKGNPWSLQVGFQPRGLQQSDQNLMAAVIIICFQLNYIYQLPQVKILQLEADSLI